MYYTTTKSIEGVDQPVLRTETIPLTIPPFAQFFAANHAKNFTVSIVGSTTKPPDWP